MAGTPRALEVAAGLARCYWHGRRGDGERARAELVSLGPVWHKMGQALAARPDVVGRRWADHLRPLQNESAPFPFAEAAMVMNDDLECDCRDLFQFHDAQGNEVAMNEDPPAVGVGSLGQVYRASPRRGPHKNKQIALKVQRPGALESVTSDAALIRGTKRVEEGLGGPRSVFREVAEAVTTALLQELDYEKEAQNAAEFAQVALEVPQVAVPLPIDAFSKDRVLATEWADGKTPQELVDMGDLDSLKALACIAIECTMAQLLATNVLHGDPHGGNLLLRNDGEGRPELVYLDFGVLCRVSKREARGLLAMSARVTKGDYAKVAASLRDMGVIGEDADEEVVGRALQSELAGQTNQEAINAAMIKVGAKFGFKFPAFYALLSRALAPIEGYGRLADPNFNVMAESYPCVMRRLCCDNSPEGRALVRELALDGNGNLDLNALRTIGLDVGGAIALAAGRPAGALRRVLLESKLDWEASDFGWRDIPRTMAAVRAARLQATTPQRARRLGMIARHFGSQRGRSWAEAATICAAWAAFTVELVVRKVLAGLAGLARRVLATVSGRRQRNLPRGPASAT